MTGLKRERARRRLTCIVVAVIKLKQVEHVRNERKSLAAVAGFPFITNLAASFSDDECLYMLVSLSSLSQRAIELTATAGLLSWRRNFHRSEGAHV